jgi:hypothetical protein
MGLGPATRAPVNARDAGPERRAPFAAGPAPEGRLVEQAQSGRIHDAEDGPSGREQPDRHRPVRDPGQEGAGAVDRIDDPDEVAGEPHGIVRGFLREPGGLGQSRREALLQEGVDRQIRLGDGGVAGLLPDPRAGLGALPEMRERDGAGLAGGLLQGAA